MRRILGATGAPQIIAPITAGQAPLLDLTSAQAAQLLEGRTAYVDLWAYLPYDDLGAAVATTPYPGFVGITATNDACVLVQSSNVLSTNNRIAQAAKFVGHGQGALPSVFPARSTMNPLGPTKVLERYPIAGGQALWFVHNYQFVTGNRQMYVWGYYTIDVDDEIVGPQRPLQAVLGTPQVPYMPPNCRSDGVPVDVHEVDSTFTDIVQLDVKIVGYNGAVPSTEELSADGSGYLQPASDTPTDPVITRLRFTTGAAGGLPVDMPIWSGGEDIPDLESVGLQRASWWRTWLDGIPMRGAGKIQIVRSVVTAPLTARSCAKGTFVRG